MAGRSLDSTKGSQDCPLGQSFLLQPTQQQHQVSGHSDKGWTEDVLESER